MELEALKKSYQALRIKHEQTEDKLADFRDKLKGARQELNTKDRQLDVAKRMVARISEEKNKAALASEHGRAQVKKLEAKVPHHDGPSDTSAKISRLQLKLSEQKEQMQEMEARKVLAEETSLQLSQEVHVLKRALGMKKNLVDGAMDNQAKLLHQLAKSQEESTALAVQLAEMQKAKQQQHERLDKAASAAQHMHAAQAQADARLAEARQQVAEALESAAAFRQEAEIARMHIARMQGDLEKESVSRARAEQQAAHHLEKVHQLTERMQSVERASRLSVEALRSEVTLAVERAESRAAEHRASWAVKEAHMSDQCLMLKAELGSAQEQLRDEKEQHETSLVQLKQKIEAMEDEAERLRRAEREHVMEIGRLHGQVDSISELNKVLKSRLESAEDKATLVTMAADSLKVELQEHQEQSGQLRVQVERLKAQISAMAAEYDAREHETQGQVQAMRKELAANSLASSKMQAELLAAKKQASKETAHIGRVDDYVQELLQTIEALTESKNKLQSYMLEQLSAFKSKLQHAEEDNQQLRAALAPRSREYAAPKPVREDFSDSEDQSSISMSAGFGNQHREPRVTWRSGAGLQRNEDSDSTDVLLNSKPRRTEGHNYAGFV